MWCGVASGLRGVIITQAVCERLYESGEPGRRGSSARAALRSARSVSSLAALAALAAGRSSPYLLKPQFGGRTHDDVTLLGHVG